MSGRSRDPRLAIRVPAKISRVPARKKLIPGVNLNHVPLHPNKKVACEDRYYCPIGSYVS